MTSHKELIVYQKSIDFVTKIYQVTQQFPKEEMFGLTNQIRRAAVSIPSNIAEGSARKHNKELIQFIYIALGSSTEIETQLLIAKNIKYITDETFNELNSSVVEISKMLIGLIRSLDNNKVSG